MMLVQEVPQQEATVSDVAPKPARNPLRRPAAETRKERKARYAAKHRTDLQLELEAHARWLARQPGGKRADFSGQVLENVSFKGYDLRGANFRKTVIIKCSFRHCNVERTDFRDSLILESNFAYANKRQALFKNSTMDLNT